MWAFVSQSETAHLNSSVFGNGENISNRLLMFAHGRGVWHHQNFLACPSAMKMWKEVTRKQ